MPLSTPSTKKSIARKLSILSLCGLMLLLLAVSIALGVIEHRSTHALMVTSITERVQSITAVADASDQINRGQLLRSFQNFRRKFAIAPEVNEQTGEFKSSENVINDDFIWVDQFSKENGGIASVFSKKGSDFVVISTSLRKEDGTRTTGELLERTHPAYAAILAGKPYTNAAVLHGKSYMTHYEPAKNSAGAVVGIFLIANDISFQQLILEKQIADIQFFETGGVYVIDSQGPLSEARFAVHPTAKGKKVLDVYPLADKFLDELTKTPDGYVRNAFPVLGEKQEDKWAVMRQTKNGNGWIVAEVSERESMTKYWTNMALIWSLLAGTAILLGIGLFALIRRTISAPLAELTSAVTLVAHGDLTQMFHTQRQDEIGDLVNEVEHMRVRYQQALSQVSTSVENISQASSEIASGNQDLSSRTELTASNLQRAASSMEQLTGTVKQSVEAARQANQLATSAGQVAARGGVVVSEVVATMNDINQSSNQISDIISVIDGIAFQTNILALNAAVEAARAGEQGRGFAVVASEVRSLAQRSAEAAKEIKALIDASVVRVESGSRLVKNAGNTMNEIVGSVQRVCDIIGEITASASEQSQGIEQVNKAVSELDQMTQQNAALVEESTAASESLRDQMHLLEQAVSVFNLVATSK